MTRFLPFKPLSARTISDFCSDAVYSFYILMCNSLNTIFHFRKGEKKVWRRNELLGINIIFTIRNKYILCYVCVCYLFCKFFLNYFFFLFKSRFVWNLETFVDNWKGNNWFVHLSLLFINQSWQNLIIHKLIYSECVLSLCC